MEDILDIAEDMIVVGSLEVELAVDKLHKKEVVKDMLEKVADNLVEDIQEVVVDNLVEGIALVDNLVEYMVVVEYRKEVEHWLELVVEH